MPFSWIPVLLGIQTLQEDVTPNYAAFTGLSPAELLAKYSGVSRRLRDDQSLLGECAPDLGSVYVTLPDPTADHRTIVLAAVEACRKLFRGGYGYKKAGVLITRLVQEESHTRSLFEDTAVVERESRLSGAIDTIHQVYGRSALLLGVQGDGQIKMVREHCSPHYTTRWEELPGVVVR